MSKKCECCGTIIDDGNNYCTHCGVLWVDKSNFTYDNKTYKEPSLYNYKNSLGNGETNVRYSKLVKYINATFAIGIGVAVAAIVLIAWITYGI